MANAYDVVVIGAGTGGYVAAIRAAQLGLSVGVVEREATLGGTCLNWGCIPTKALLEHAHAFKVAQEAKEWGLSLRRRADPIDMGQVHARKDKIVKGLTGGVAFLFKKNKIDWIKGTARLLGSGQVEVTGSETADDRRPRRSSSPPGRRRAASRASRSITSASSPATTRSTCARSRSRSSSWAAARSASSSRRSSTRSAAHVTIIELLPRIVPNEDEAGVGRAREDLQEAEDQRHDRHARSRSATPGADGVEIEAADAGRQGRDADGRLPARRDRPRSGHDRARRRGARPRDGARLHQGRRAVPHRACPASRRSAT